MRRVTCMGRDEAGKESMVRKVERCCCEDDIPFLLCRSKYSKETLAGQKAEERENTPLKMLVPSTSTSSWPWPLERTSSALFKGRDAEEEPPMARLQRVVKQSWFMLKEYGDFAAGKRGRMEDFGPERQREART